MKKRENFLGGGRESVSNWREGEQIGLRELKKNIKISFILRQALNNSFHSWRLKAKVGLR